MLLGKAEADETAGINYGSSMQLDIQRDVEAVAKLGDDNRISSRCWQEANARHVEDVQRLQCTMRISDVVFRDTDDH